MKAKTQVRIGLWGAMAFVALRVSQAFWSWEIYSPEYKKGFIFSTIIFAIYIFGIVSKRLKVAWLIFYAWVFFVSLQLIVLFNMSVVSDKWSGSLENILTTLRIFSSLGVPLGILTLVLWIGLRGLTQIMDEENQPKDEQKQ
jgi:hypothetical protein